MRSFQFLQEGSHLCLRELCVLIRYKSLGHDPERAQRVSIRGSLRFEGKPKKGKVMLAQYQGWNTPIRLATG